MIFAITSDKLHSSFLTIAKKVSESLVISSYEQNKKQGKKHMINYSIARLDLIKLISKPTLS